MSKNYKHVKFPRFLSLLKLSHQHSLLQAIFLPLKYSSNIFTSSLNPQHVLRIKFNSHDCKYVGRCNNSVLALYSDKGICPTIAQNCTLVSVLCANQQSTSSVQSINSAKTPEQLGITIRVCSGQRMTTMGLISLIVIQTKINGLPIVSMSPIKVYHTESNS